MSVFVIAEAASTWRFGDDHLANAYRSIRGAKECGADAAKFQWVSDGQKLAIRRLEPDHQFDQGGCGEDQCPTCNAGEMYSRYVHFPAAWLPLLKAECDRVGIEFMCTAYLPQDVAVLAPYLKRFKVAAKESYLADLRDEIIKHRKPVIVSCADTENAAVTAYFQHDPKVRGHLVFHLWCVSKYPASIDEAKLRRLREWSYISGWSDHTAHVLTGAVAVGAGARIIESHVRLHDTPAECPDYGHSLVMLEPTVPTPAHVYLGSTYADYVEFIRIAERML